MSAQVFQHPAGPAGGERIAGVSPVGSISGADLSSIGFQPGQRANAWKDPRELRSVQILEQGPARIDKIAELLIAMSDAAVEWRESGPALINPDRLTGLTRNLSFQDVKLLDQALRDKWGLTDGIYGLLPIQEHAHIVFPSFPSAEIDSIAVRMQRGAGVSLRDLHAALTCDPEEGLPKGHEGMLLLNGHYRHTQLLLANLGPDPRNPLSKHLAHFLQRLQPEEQRATMALIEGYLGTNYGQAEWQRLIANGERNPLFFERVYREKFTEALTPGQQAVVEAILHYEEPIAAEAIRLAEALRIDPEDPRALQQLREADERVARITEVICNESEYARKNSQLRLCLTRALTVECSERRFTIRHVDGGYLVAENGTDYYFPHSSPAGARIAEAYQQGEAGLSFAAQQQVEERVAAFDWLEAVQRNLKTQLWCAARDALALPSESVRPRVRSENYRLAV